MGDDVVNWYIQNRPIYKRLATKVESLLIEVFDMDNISYHIVNSRTKDIKSVKNKALSDKYDDPINQIQDYVGIRIITYVEDEVEQVCKVIEKIFDIDIDNSSNKSDDLGIDKVGYKSVHYIASLKNDRLKLPEYKQYEGKCFEIQVRTILQHAWAEIEHDRNYKFSGKLPDKISRRFKILSGVLEMSDREFNSISNDIDAISSSVIQATKSGELDIPLSSTSLVQFLSSKFQELVSLTGEIVPGHSEGIIDELNKYGIHTLADLSEIMPKDIEEFYIAVFLDSATVGGMMRSLMILTDYHKYFTEARIKVFHAWYDLHMLRDPDFVKEYFSKAKVDWEDIEKKYDVKFCR